MNNIDNILQSIRSIGFDVHVKQPQEEVDPNVVKFGKLFDTGSRFHGILVSGSYHSQTGQYTLDLGTSANDLYQVMVMKGTVSSEARREAAKLEGLQFKRNLEEVCERVFNDAKKELGIPDDVDIGHIYVMVGAAGYTPQIKLSGSDLGELYERFKTLVEKLGFSIDSPKPYC